MAANKKIKYEVDFVESYAIVSKDKVFCFSLNTKMYSRIDATIEEHIKQYHLQKGYKEEYEVKVNKKE